MTQSTKSQKKGKVLSSGNTSKKTLFSHFPSELDKHLKISIGQTPPNLQQLLPVADPSQKNTQTFKITTPNNPKMPTPQNQALPIASQTQRSDPPVKIITPSKIQSPKMATARNNQSLVVNPSQSNGQLTPNKSSNHKTITTQNKQSPKTSEQLTNNRQVKNITPQEMRGVTYIQKPSATSTKPTINTVNSQKSINTTPASQKTFTHSNLRSSPTKQLKVGQTPTKNIHLQKGSPLSNVLTQQDLSPLNELLVHHSQMMSTLKNKLQYNGVESPQIIKSPTSNSLRVSTNQDVFIQTPNTHQSPNFNNMQSKFPTLKNLQSPNMTNNSPSKNLVLKKTTTENTSTIKNVLNTQQPSPTRKKSLKSNQIAFSSPKTKLSQQSGLDQVTSVITHSNIIKAKVTNNTEAQSMSKADQPSPLRSKSSPHNFQATKSKTSTSSHPLKSMEELAKDLLSSPTTSAPVLNNQIQSRNVQKDESSKIPQERKISTTDVKKQSESQTMPSANIDVCFILKFCCSRLF